MHGVENVGGLNAKLQRAGFFYRDDFAEVHVKHELPGAVDGVAPGMAEGTSGEVRAGDAGAGRAGAKGRGWRTKRRSVEPFERGWIAECDWRAGRVGAQRAAHAAADVERIAQHARREVEPGADGEIAAPLPAAQNVGKRSALREAVILAKGQFVNPVASEFVALVKTGEAAVGGDIERILRDHRAATADGGSVVDGFGVRVGPRNRDTVGHAPAQANRCRIINRIAVRRFIDEGLDAGDGDGALDVEPRTFRTVVPDIHHQAAGELALNVQVPDLHVAEAIVRVDSKIIGDGGGGGRRTLWERGLAH